MLHTASRLNMYILNHGPLVFVLENVIGLTGENLKECLRLLRLAGYWVSVHTVNAATVFLPQERNRLWIVGVRTDLACKFDSHLATEPMYEQFMASTLAVLTTGNECLDVDDFLLDDTDAAVINDIADHSSHHANPGKDKWIDKHIAYMGLSAWLASTSILDPELDLLYPGLATFTPRQLDLCECLCVPLPDPQGRIVNVSQSLDFCHATPHNRIGTITPGGRFLLADRVDIVNGISTSLFINMIC